MDRLLARLERTFGRFAIENLMTYIVSGMAIVFVLSLSKPELIDYLDMDPWRAPHEPWRFFTFLFIPPNLSPMWILFTLYWTWLMGTNLEHEWGAFKLNVFYFVGALGTIAVAYLLGPIGGIALNLSMTFAFATVFPDFEIRLFFIIPIRMKWLALLSLAPIVFIFVFFDITWKAAIIVAFANYLLFFTGHLIGLAKGEMLAMKQGVRRASFRAEAEAERTKTRTCAICGASQDAGADIRVCSCEKCGKPRDLCLEHARNH